MTMRGREMTTAKRKGEREREEGREKGGGMKQELESESFVPYFCS